MSDSFNYLDLGIDNNNDDGDSLAGDDDEDEDCFDVFEPINLNYDDRGGVNVTNHGGDGSDNDGSVIKLRFSDISLDAEKIITSIVEEAEKDAAAAAAAEKGTVKQPSALSLMTNVLMEDSISGLSSARTSTVTFSPMNEKRSYDPHSGGGDGEDDHEPLPFLRSPVRGGSSRSSILSVRPNLLTPELADKLLEGIMNIDNHSNRNLEQQQNSSDEHKNNNNVDDDRVDVQAAAADDAGNLLKENYYERESLGASNGSNGSAGSVRKPSLSLSPHQTRKKKKQFRFSIAADLTDFGPGGVPIVQEGLIAGSGSDKRKQSMKGMRFAISKRALNMFDMNEEDNLSDVSNDNDAIQEETYFPETGGGVLSSSLQHYRNESIGESVLAREMNQLAFDDGHHQIRANSLLSHNPQNMMMVKTEIYMKQLNEYLLHKSILVADQNEYWKNKKIPLLGEDVVNAYVEAESMNPGYVNSNQLRLMFLKYRIQHKMYDTDMNGDELCVKWTANQIVYHFYKKKQLFGGGQILGRDVRLSDFSIDDRKSMESGGMQIMPTRDAAGRIVLVYAHDQKTYRTEENWIRCIWYMFWQVAKDGADLVYINTGIGRQDSFRMIQEGELVYSAFPLKTKAIHWCYDGTDHLAKQLIIAKKVHFYNQNDPTHFREHFNPNGHDRICFKLETFGISIDTSIFQPHGRLGLEWHMEWLKNREFHESIEQEEENQRNQKQNQRPQETKSAAVQKEKATKDKTNSTTSTNDNRGPHSNNNTNTNVIGSSTIIVNRYDVLFGRGKYTREHTGNLRCAHWVEQHKQEYDAARKSEKTKIAERIVIMVLDSGGRFLKKDKDRGWSEVTRKEARDKVAHFFRHLRAEEKKKS